MIKSIFCLIIIVSFWTIPLFADVVDGTHEAVVTTDSGSYTVSVEVEDGSVTYVHWPNGGDMTVYGGEVDECVAVGTNSRGDQVTIEIDDCNDKEDESE